MRNHFITKRMADDSLFLIDIDKILREKAPKHVKYIPKFVVSYLKRIVHQDELNVFLRESKDKVGMEFLQACLDFLDARLIVKGKENLRKDGLYTFVSNHPLGGQDGVALGYVLGSFYDGKVKYMVNDLLMNLHGLAPLCIPINKTGKQAKDFLSCCWSTRYFHRAGSGLPGQCRALLASPEWSHPRFGLEKDVYSKEC